MITAAIQSFCEMLKSFFRFKQTDTLYKSTKVVINDKKSVDIFSKICYN